MALVWNNGPVVATSQGDHPALASSLERELIKEVDAQLRGLLSSKDWPDFERRRGTINGMNITIGFCREIQKRLEA